LLFFGQLTYGLRLAIYHAVIAKKRQTIYQPVKIMVKKSILCQISQFFYGKIKAELPNLFQKLYFRISRLFLERVVNEGF